MHSAWRCSGACLAAGAVRRGSHCGGGRCAPTSLRCSCRGSAAELALCAARTPLKQLRRACQRSTLRVPPPALRFSPPQRSPRRTAPAAKQGLMLALQFGHAVVHVSFGHGEHGGRARKTAVLRDFAECAFQVERNTLIRIDRVLCHVSAATIESKKRVKHVFGGWGVEVQCIRLPVT